MTERIHSPFQPKQSPSNYIYIYNHKLKRLHLFACVGHHHSEILGDGVGFSYVVVTVVDGVDIVIINVIMLSVGIFHASFIISQPWVCVPLRCGSHPCF